MRTGILAGSVTLALPASPALAQSCENVLVRGTSAVSGGLAISSAMTAANTAFLTEGAAFVSAPANASPGAEGSGIWIRGVGGTMTVNSSTSINSRTTTSAGSTSAGTTCSTRFEQTFGGFQLGHDVARLNVGGWNLILGTTAGFLETAGHIAGGNVVGGAFNSTTQAPFAGTYAAATYGNFFINGLLRYDYFQTSLDSPSVNFFDQKIGAHGFTAAAAAGYNWKVPNSKWFVEPGAGVVWSREAVEPLNALNLFMTQTSAGGAAIGFSTPGTTRIDTIESVIGRVGVRVGTTLETASAVYQPFAAVSVWHDFGRGLAANTSSCPNCMYQFGNGTFNAQFGTSGIGTFGQYSAGVSALIKDTGWLGFARVDYREGSALRALSGSGGIRYQFSPTEAKGAMPAKAPADHAVNWTGLYVGGFGGAQNGRASMEFPGVSTADLRPAGWLGGAAIGYNYQAGRWVLGVEGDFAGTNASGAAECAPLVGQLRPGGNPAQVALFQTTCHDDLNWVATATARLGYAWTPRTLFYVKAGGAWADEELSWTCNLGPENRRQGGQNCANSAIVVSDGASARGIRAGWTAGFGTEFALTDRWSIKGEFDWLDFGARSLTWSDGTAVNSSLRTAQGRIGVNYKLFAP